MSETIEDTQRIPEVELLTEQDTLFVHFRIVKSEPTMTLPSYNYRALLDEHNRINNSLKSLKTLKDKGLIDEQTMIETMKQQAYLEDNRDKITLDRGYVVACGEQLFFGDTQDEAVKKAHDAVGNKPYYSESIGLIDFPSPFYVGD